MIGDSWSQPVFAAIAERVQTLAGLEFSPARRPQAETGILRAMTRAGLKDINIYAAHLRTLPSLPDELVAELVVGETYFFRDSGQFDLIRNDILPAIRQTRPADATTRVWSAGCATGEEAYSLAILLEEAGFGSSASVLGTDICKSALAKARLAKFGAWSFRGVSDEMMQQYFTQAGGRYQLADQIRRRVTWSIVNLAGSDYPSKDFGPGFDLILCRNVLIYFSSDMIRFVAESLLACLADGGWLITGASDPMLSDYTQCEAVMTPAGIAYRRGTGRTTHLPAPAPPAMPAVPVDVAARIRQPALPGAAAIAWLPRIEAPTDRTDLSDAETDAAEAVRRDPLSAECQFHHAVLLAELGKTEAAVEVLRRVLYLDPGLAIAHVALGSLRQRLGAPDDARQSYRNAYEIVRRRPPEEIIPLADGEQAGALAGAIEEVLGLETTP